MKLLHVCTWALAGLFSAQAAAQAGAYLLFTGASLDTTTSTETYTTSTTGPSAGEPIPTGTTTNTTGTKIFGPTFGLYGQFPTPIVKIGADMRGQLLNGGGVQHYSGVAGPRLALELPALSLRPYIEALAGFGSYNTQLSSRTDIHVDYEFLVGVDRKLLPLIDWRVLEFSYANYYGGSVPTKALSTGLVLRF